jgi:NTP pyrophosphatase (non-canonical NTP hydrolase)
MTETATSLAALSTWLDSENQKMGRDGEAITWGRLAKVGEECGEVIAAWIGATGQNPRKGFTHTPSDVIEELLDVAVTALGAVEHMVGNDGKSMALLEDKIRRVVARANRSRLGGLDLD